ncbi:MAG: hypothetical protein CBC83_06750 [Flavobacteriales bacterium TMED123]|nr:MAG: hypothetical protein CBC83_06750 [Flavobacteriales bacterium TMED123]
MKHKKLQEKLFLHFPFTPTKQQEQLISDLANYITTLENKSIFLLKGYAGTGKTTIVASLVKSLPVLGKRSVLLSPTGKAAKVLSNYSKKSASTIHKKIYWIRTNKKGNAYITLKKNTHTNTIFIVDEASMIPASSDKGFGNRSLLDDLIAYINDGMDCKLFLIGDTAQLPPVHLDISPALDEEFLQKNYNKSITVKQLTQVVRQQQNSEILKNATALRKQITKEDYCFPKFSVNTEVIRLNTGENLQDALESAYSNEGVNATTVLCRSNKRANLYNQQIRTKIRWQEDEISAGDLLIVVRNNYYWMEQEEMPDFIANGDSIEVVKIKERIKRYGFHFAKATIKLVDGTVNLRLEVILLLDTLTSNNASLTNEQYCKLYDEICLDYKGEKEINQKVKDNPFYNALYVKFAYAITCHKSQGGEWENVFVDLGYFTEEMLDKSYLRWLYTALTRASKKLYLINFNDKFFN